ncbi:MAG TPA: DUF6265 family protein [Vicinamibacterales bacterium]
MSRRALAIFVLALASAPAMAQPAAGRATLADLAWIAGHWVSGESGTLSEEVWTAPHGDSMLGMWRLVRDGESRVFELMAIVQTPDGPLFRLRHFTRDFVAWEEKDQAIALPLARRGADEAVFEGSGTDGKPLRLTYQRAGSDVLRVLLEHGSERQQFEFRRAAAPAR